MIYMDNAASTKPSEEVLAKMRWCAELVYGNPSSMHQKGYEAANVIDESSDIIAQILNCDPNEIYYTSGATMSNNLAIQGWVRSNPDGCFIYSAVEHADILLLADWLASVGYPVYKVPVNSDGFISFEALIALLEQRNDRPTLVSIQMANGETGVIQDIKSISSLVHKYNGVFHTDATQFIAHYPVDVRVYGIDMMSMSGQKINCIKGIGLLYVNDDIKLSPVIFGEQGFIGGTENVIGIACLAEAFRIKDQYDLYDCVQKQKKLMDVVSFAGGIIVGSRIQRLPNNVCAIFRKNGDLVQFLDSKGICVSSGSACSSHSDKPSHVMLAMGYSDVDADHSVRFTIGKDTSYDDINYVGKTLSIF